MPSWNRVVGRGPTNMVEEELADIYNKYARQRRPVFGWSGRDIDSVEVESPPDFRPNTLTPPPVSSQTEEPIWDYIHRVAPETRGRSGRIQYGVNRGAIEDLESSGFDPEDYPTVNLLGGTERGGTRDISLNPRLAIETYGLEGPFNEDATVAHEIGHSVNIPHGREMNNIEGLAGMAREYERMKRNKGVASYDMIGMGGNINTEHLWKLPRFQRLEPARGRK